jgi:hypothetical protein
LAHLRFIPDEYRAIECLCRPLQLHDVRPNFVKRLLVASLSDTLPHLAERIARLNPDQLRLLLTHLHGRSPVKSAHGLTADEVELLTEAAGPLFAHARFAHLLKRSVVRQLSVCHPDLALKVDRLSLAQFTHLVEEVTERSRGNS